MRKSRNTLHAQMSGLKILLWHVLAVGLWSGCVATEVVCEKVLVHENKEVKRAAAQLRYWMDLIVGIPASLCVLASGAMMIANSGCPRSDRILAAKILAGGIAVGCNFACFSSVQKRYLASVSNDWDEYEAQDESQRRLGKGVAHGTLLALGLGLILTNRD